MKKPANKLQESLWLEAEARQSYLVESLDDFYYVLNRLVEIANAKYPRCRPEKATRYNYDKSTTLMGFGEFWRYTVREVIGSHTAKGGFQPFIELEGGERL